MKKVLFLITSLGGGGAERVLINLVNNLDKTKYDITIQTIFDVGVNRQYIPKHVRYIPGFKKQFHGNVMIMRMFSPKLLYKMLIKEDYDIAVAYLEGPPVRILSGCDNPNTTKIAWIHGEAESAEAFGYSFGGVQKAEDAYNSMDEVVCVADTVKSNFTSLLNITTKVETLYNVNESEKIKSLAEETIDDIFDTKCPNIISVGRLIDVKGYDRLIRIHKRLINEGYEHNLFILGDGNRKEMLESLIESQNVKKTAHLLGFSSNPYKYVSKADLFVCSSLREGFSTAVTEALILGVPVVSTKVSGANELLGFNNEYGIVTENNEEALYEGIRTLLADTGKLEKYKEQAQFRGKAFDTATTTGAVEKMMDSLN